MWAICLLTALLVVLAQGQIPIPKRETGYAYNGGKDDAPVHIDFYIDQICPDSKQAYPTLLKVADHYGAKTLQLTSHLFPLPYHRVSFYATKGAHVIDSLSKGNLTYKWFETIYDHIDSLYNKPTHDLSDAQVVQMLAQYASGLGIQESDFVSMVDTDDIEMDTRTAWKYACTRGVAATPTFMVNDIVIQASQTWTVEEWKKIIDPLLA